ncbi:hypothetical protein STEG23_009234 [Scotinomys teguina]
MRKEELRVVSSLRVEEDASSGGPYGEPSLLWSPELSAVVPQHVCMIVPINLFHYLYNLFSAVVSAHCCLFVLVSYKLVFGISSSTLFTKREDVILEWIFLSCKPNKKLKTYIEKISDLIHKGKLRLRQLTGMDPAEIVVPLTNEEVSSQLKDNEYWQRAFSNFLGEINNRYPKSKRIEFVKKTEWVLPHIVQQKPISGVLTFYTDANKLGKAGYKSGDLSKVVQSPYNSVQKAELYAILMVLMDFTEPLNIVTDSQYAERVILHIETADFIPDNTELMSLFIQLQEIIRNREHPIYITHIKSHTGLPGQGNDEIDQLLIGNVLEASEFHKKHHVNSKGLKKDFPSLGNKPRTL